MLNITSATSNVVLICAGLKIVAPLSQFSTDQSISQGDEEIAVTRMGVDGHMAAGWIPTIKNVTISFEPSSPSVAVFDLIYKASAANKKVYEISMIVTVNATGKVLRYTGGVLKQWKLLPDHKQVLDPISAVMDFEAVE